MPLLITGCRTDSDTGIFTDTIELTAQETTLEEASNMLGVILPLPDYLPEDYEIQEVYLLYAVYHRSGGVKLILSKDEIEKELVTQSGASGPYQQYEFQCPMTIEINYSSEGIPGGLKFGGVIVEPVEITPVQGTITISLIVYRENYNELWWEWRPDSYDRTMFKISIASNKQILPDELIKIAESFNYQVS